MVAETVATHCLFFCGYYLRVGFILLRASILFEGGISSENTVWKTTF